MPTSEARRFRARVKQQIKERSLIGESGLGIWWADSALGPMQSQAWLFDDPIVNDVKRQRAMIAEVAVKRPRLLAVSTLVQIVGTREEAEAKMVEQAREGGGYDAEPGEARGLALTVMDHEGALEPSVCPTLLLDQIPAWQDGGWPDDDETSSGPLGLTWVPDIEFVMQGRSDA